jgi:tRNA G18 (ribose-2'-O)-methylase SpoU
LGIDIVPIRDFEDPRVAAYRNVKDRSLHLERASFLVEGEGALLQLLESTRFEPESLLLSPRALKRIEPSLTALPDSTPVYVAERADYHEIVGFDLHRGCLALCRRPSEPGFGELLAAPALDARAPLLALEAITNHDNVGGLFRNARAFGAAGVLLCPKSCDPLYRKSIRTSIGATLELPFARAARWPDDLVALGVPIVALHPDASEPSVALADWTPPAGRFVLVAGTEGPGLSPELLAVADTKLHIEMEPGIDSINVALAAGIALHHVRALRHRSAAFDA